MDRGNEDEIPGTAGLLPIERNKRGKIVSLDKRLRIINMYKTNLEKNPNMSTREIRKNISQLMGIGEITVYKTIREYIKTNTVTSPKRTKKRKSFRELYDDFSRNAVCRHVHSIWFRREIPTVDKIFKAVSDDENLPPISRTNLFRLLKDLDFRYCKRTRNGALMEKNKMVLWRRRYLKSILKYREEGRHIYYLDKTWVNAGDCSNKVWVDMAITSNRDAFLKGLTTGSVNPSVKGNRLIVLHIGSEDGFVPGGLLCLESKKNSHDYHDEINEETFREWMENILPKLRDNSVIVMDNASYHSAVKMDKDPTPCTRKADILKWLEDKGEVIDTPMIIAELLEIVKHVKPIHEKYVIDELTKSSNKTILRLPPYHNELNPIKLAWSSIKNHVRMNNTTFKLPNVKKLLIEGIDRVNGDMWNNFIKHTMEEEKKFWEVDFIIDDVLSAEIQNSTMTRSRDTSSDSDSEST